MTALIINDRLTLPSNELSWKAVRASGPGGQNVNKVASKVELRFALEASEVLSPPVKARLRRIASSRLDSQGNLVVTSSRTRDQSRNLEDAREKLAQLVRRALVKPKPRKPTKPSKQAKERRLTEKRHRGQKKERRTFRGADDD